MQYFVEYTEFRRGQPFTLFLMVELRRRIDMAEIQTIIDEVDEENRKAIRFRMVVQTEER